MDKIVQQLKRQQEINFKNIRDQIEMADLETVFDTENNSRYIFHYLHSMDRFFINPNDYVEVGNLNLDSTYIDELRENSLI